MAEQAFALARNKGNWVEVSAVICCVALRDRECVSESSLTLCGGSLLEICLRGYPDMKITRLRRFMVHTQKFRDPARRSGLLDQGILFQIYN